MCGSICSQQTRDVPHLGELQLVYATGMKVSKAAAIPVLRNQPPSELLLWSAGATNVVQCRSASPTDEAVQLAEACCCPVITRQLDCTICASHAAAAATVLTKCIVATTTQRHRKISYNTLANTAQHTAVLRNLLLARGSHQASSGIAAPGCHVHPVGINSSDQQQQRCSRRTLSEREQEATNGAPCRGLVSQAEGPRGEAHAKCEVPHDANIQWSSL
jgi:hypothetical protein